MIKNFLYDKDIVGKIIRLIVFIFLFIFILHYIEPITKKYAIYKKEARGIIKEMRIYRGGQYFYFEGGKLDGYFFDDFEAIKVGDSIAKEKDSKEVYIYRKINNEYILLMKNEWWLDEKIK